MNSVSTSNTARNQRVFRAISYMLVFLMMACSILTMGILINMTLPDWHAGIIMGVLLFIVIDRIYTYRHLKSLTPLSAEWGIAWGAQWVLILVLTRFLLSYAHGTEAFLEDLLMYTRGNFARLFTGEFVITLLLAVPIWILPAQFLALLDEIGLNSDLALREDAPPIELNAVPAHQRLVNLIFSLGIVLVVLTVLTRLNVRNLLADLNGLSDLQVSRFSGAEAGVLLYFVFGLTLLSLSRLMSLQTHWNRLRIPVSSNNLVRQWVVYSLLFLLILAVVVGLLPAGDSFGFMSLLGTLLSFLFATLFFIGQLFLVLISLLFSLPLLFLRGEPAVMDNVPVAPVFPTLPVEPATPPVPNETWLLVRSVLLWGLLAVIVVFAFLQYVRQHGGLRAALRNSRVTNWLLLAWQWLYKGAGNVRDNLSHVLAEGWQSLVSQFGGRGVLPPASLLHFRSLNPRQRIYFFYLAMIRRGAEQGVRRQPSQTPSEYAASLEKALPAAGEEIGSITGAFIEARYSRQDIDSKKADTVKTTWGRLRRKVKGEKSSTK
jgi:hypothetical protein